MQSITRETGKFNGYTCQETVIGKVTVAAPIERRISYETASWYTLVEVPAGEYEVVISYSSPGNGWVLVKYEGTITDEHFVNRVFGSSALAEKRNIGKPSGCSAQLHGFMAAREFAENPAWELADDWSIDFTSYEGRDGEERLLHWIVKPDGERARVH